MNAPGERGSASVLSVALYNRLSVSQGLAVTAGNAVGRSRSLCRTIHDRRRQPDFFRHLAKYVQMRPHLRRFLPVCGAAADLAHIETTERPEGLVVHVAGEIDLVNVDGLRNAIRPAVANCRNVVVDMTDLKYVDGAGLHVLIDAVKELRRNGCQLVVVGASSVIAKVMRILQLDSLIPIVSTLDEAMDLIQVTSRGSATDH